MDMSGWHPTQLLSNVWIVGIATGIASGLITTWIARLLLSRKDSREYRQSLNAANREVILAIRSTIPESQLPTRTVIEALRQATARRFDVAAKDMFTRAELVQELTKEVMDSSFLSPDKKAEYCALLLPIALINLAAASEAEEGTKSTTEIEDERASDLAQARERNVTFLSLLTGALTALVAAITTIYMTGDTFLGPHYHRFSRSEVLGLVVQALTAIFCVALLPRGIFRKLFSKSKTSQSDSQRRASSD